MRIAVFTSEFPGQVSTFFARDMRALMEAGMEIDVFPIYPLDASLWRHVPPILGDDILARDRVHHLSLSRSLLSLRPWPLRKISRLLLDAAAINASALRFGLLPCVKSTYVLPKAWAWAQQTADQYDHVLSYWGNYSATCAYMFHRLSARRIPFSTFLHAGTDLYRDQVFLRQKLLYADRIIVVCNFNREFVRQLYPDIFDQIEHKFYRHHIGLDLSEMPDASDTRPPNRVIAVGRFVKEKGFDYLLHAAHQLARRGITIDVHLVGDGPEAGSLERLAQELGIANHVFFRGWLSAEEVQQAMRESTLLVHPSPGLGDAVPTVIKEAMAMRTPVIATRMVGIPELLDDGRCGVLVPPQDANSIAEAIERLLKNDPLRHEYADVARHFAEEQFDAWKNGQRLAGVLRAAKRPSTKSGANRSEHSPEETANQLACFDSGSTH